MLPVESVENRVSKWVFSRLSLSRYFFKNFWVTIQTFQTSKIRCFSHGFSHPFSLCNAQNHPQAAKGELVEGILQYYGTQVEWSASELPAEPDEARAPPPVGPGGAWWGLVGGVESMRCWRKTWENSGRCEIYHGLVHNLVGGLEHFLFSH